jgi:hypothetical protein
MVMNERSRLDTHKTKYRLYKFSKSTVGIIVYTNLYYNFDFGGNSIFKLKVNKRSNQVSF